LNLRFLANVKRLLQELDQAQLDRHIDICTFLLHQLVPVPPLDTQLADLNTIKYIRFDRNGHVLTGLGRIGRDDKGFKLD
jgi:hypothetical protein